MLNRRPTINGLHLWVYLSPPPPTPSSTSTTSTPFLPPLPSNKPPNRTNTTVRSDFIKLDQGILVPSMDVLAWHDVIGSRQCHLGVICVGTKPRDYLSLAYCSGILPLCRGERRTEKSSSLTTTSRHIPERTLRKPVRLVSVLKVVVVVMVMAILIDPPSFPPMITHHISTANTSI